MGNEPVHVVAAILILFVICGVGFVSVGDYTSLSKVFVFSIVVILVNVFAKKVMAYWLDSSVEHKIWTFQRFGVREHWHFPRPVGFGWILPLFFSFFSLGAWKVMTILTYETKALKHRAAKRHGFYSYAEMTDWHNAWIGAAGIIALWILALVTYFPGLELLTKIATYYAVWSMVPVSKLDGTQIYFGSRVLWFVLAVLSLVFALYAMVI